VESLDFLAGLGALQGESLSFNPEGVSGPKGRMNLAYELGGPLSLCPSPTRERERVNERFVNRPYNK